MAYLIDIRKTAENSTFVEYWFDGGGFDIKHGTGLIRIDKASGEVDVLEHTGDDWERLYDKVMMKIAKHWQTDDFPDKTSWAS
jgi:hypothetical protein